MRKIDVFTHISPPGYSEGVERIAGGLKDIGKRTRGVPMLHDLDVRFQVMEQFPEYQQVLSLPTPPIELYATPEQAIELARIANDSMAELVEKYPDHFVAFAAALPNTSANTTNSCCFFMVHPPQSVIPPVPLLRPAPGRRALRRQM